ncbi:MAG: hypothetical protein IPI67_32515 [Myxococcales bacterium]|nr:hypothetical protein [Myxococcales bacterium]
MITRVDEQLRREAALHSLKFSCEDCAHFVADRHACANGYPTGPHHAVQLAQVSTLEFCKEFELA